jgi:hypothetical protein
LARWRLCVSGLFYADLAAQPIHPWRAGFIELTTGDEIVIAKSKLKLVNEYFSYTSNGMEH